MPNLVRMLTTILMCKILPVGKTGGRSRTDGGLVWCITAILGRVDESRDGPAAGLGRVDQLVGGPST